MTRFDPKELARIQQMDSDTIFAEVAVRMVRVADEVTWLAAAIQVLASRQNDIAERAADICKSGFWLYLPLVAGGQVSALAVAAFCTRESLLALVAQLPIEQQEAYATAGATFEVEFTNPRYGKPNEPEFDSRKYQPYLLPDHLFPQVFDTHARTVRDKVAQRAYLKANGVQPNPTRKVRVPTLRIDTEHMLIYVDNRPVRVSAIADAVAQLAADCPEVETMFKQALRNKRSKIKTG